MVWVHTGSPSQIFFSHVGFPAMLFGAGVFATFYCYKDKFAAVSENKRRVIFAISKLTMGIFFIHPIIQDSIRKVFDFIVHDKLGGAYSGDILKYYPLTDLVFVFAVFAVSLTVCWCLAKIPYLRRVII